MFAGELPPLASAVQRAAEDEREVKFRVAYDVSVSHLQRHRTPRRRAPLARQTVAPSSHRRGMLMRSERSRGRDDCHARYGGNIGGEEEEEEHNSSWSATETESRWQKRCQTR